MTMHTTVLVAFVQIDGYTVIEKDFHQELKSEGIS